MEVPVKLNHPWLIAVWPGMGNVAISAGYYLVAKLGMELLNEFSPVELFDVEHVNVKNGLIQPAQRPRNRMFVWRDPEGLRDIVVFIGEAQLQAGKYSFCRRLVESAQVLGIERVFTFAAMASDMQPGQLSRVFVAATDERDLNGLRQHDLLLLEEGQIGGLNGVLLAAAYEAGLSGTCLLGEMPHVFLQFPFPKASLVVLDTFTSIAHLELDTSELAEQATAVDERLEEILFRVQDAMEKQSPRTEEFEAFPESETEPEPEPRLSAADEQQIENLFSQAERERAKAYELKQELDRLGVFAEYEDRFLDLFKRSE